MLSGEDPKRYDVLMNARHGEREEDAARRMAFCDAVDRHQSIASIRKRVTAANEQLKRLVPSPEERVELIRSRLWPWASFVAAEVVYGHVANDLEPLCRMWSRYDA